MMKRFVTLCALAVALLAVAEQKASAWTKWNFSAGINLSYQGGDNCLLWGLVKSGPMPGCDYGCPPVCYAPQMYQGAAAGYTGPMPTQAAPQAAPAATTTQPVGYYYYAPSYWYGY
jgi:hypothetical protein